MRVKAAPLYRAHTAPRTRTRRVAMADSDIEGEVVAIVVVEADDVAGAYRASELMGAAVVNDQDERIGTIDDFIIGRDDSVLFAVLQIGGFLGLGGRLVAVPYESLVITE